MSQRTFWDEPRPSVFQCSECSETVSDPNDVGAQDTCRKCQTDLHCCRNCTWFDTAAENECRKPVEERIAKKRANNSCPLFQPLMVVDLRGNAASRPVEAARQALDDLFRS